MRRAFTLIEAISVTAILLLTAALVTPSVVASQRSRALRDAVAALRRLPDQARAEARRTDAPVALRVDGDALVLETVPADGDPVELRRLVLDPDVAVDTTRRDGQDVDAASWSWTVYPDGTSDAAGIAFQIGGATKSLMLERTGNIRWIEGPLPDEAEERWSAGERVPRA